MPFSICSISRSATCRWYSSIRRSPVSGAPLRVALPAPPRLIRHGRPPGVGLRAGPQPRGRLEIDVVAERSVLGRLVRVHFDEPPARAAPAPRVPGGPASDSNGSVASFSFPRERGVSGLAGSALRARPAATRPPGLPSFERMQAVAACHPCARPARPRESPGRARPAARRAPRPSPARWASCHPRGSPRAPGGGGRRRCGHGRSEGNSVTCATRPVEATSEQGVPPRFQLL